MPFIFDIKKAYAISDDLREICINIYEICKNENPYISELFFGETENVTLPVSDSEASHDISLPVSDIETSHDISLPVLYYGVSEGNIVGFLSADCYGNGTVDICGYVLPKYRKLKLMSSLFDSFLTDYDNFYISATLNSKNSTGCAILSYLGFEKKATEYMMKLSFSNTCYKPLPKYVKMSVESFTNNSKCFKFAMFVRDMSVGNCLVEVFNDKAVCIHDVLIAEEYRGMGYGHKMLESVISYLSKDFAYAILHVSGNNSYAFSLYKKLGFLVVDSAEIYEM